MKNGYGTLYYLESNIIYYNGYFNNNKKNGSGKLYYKNGNLKIDGFWEDDLLINGLEYWENGKLKYEGKFKDDKYFGQSIVYLDNGNIHYDGLLENGFKNGYGKEYDNNINSQYQNMHQEVMSNNVKDLCTLKKRMLILQQIYQLVSLSSS